MSTLKLRHILLLLLVLLSLCGCSRWKSFNSQFDKRFLYDPLMRQATNLNEVVPDFSWADFGSEGLTTNAKNSGDGGSSGGGGGCPT